jgi:hypothetical protein
MTWVSILFLVLGLQNPVCILQLQNDSTWTSHIPNAQNLHSADGYCTAWCRYKSLWSHSTQFWRPWERLSSQEQFGFWVPNLTRQWPLESSRPGLQPEGANRTTLENLSRENKNELGITKTSLCSGFHNTKPQHHQRHITCLCHLSQPIQQPLWAPSLLAFGWALGKAGAGDSNHSQELLLGARDGAKHFLSTTFTHLRVPVR